jgi:hypothetical protein
MLGNYSIVVSNFASTLGNFSATVRNFSLGNFVVALRKFSATINNFQHWYTTSQQHYATSVSCGQLYCSRGIVEHGNLAFAIDEVHIQNPKYKRISHSLLPQWWLLAAPFVSKRFNLLQ